MSTFWPLEHRRLPTATPVKPIRNLLRPSRPLTPSPIPEQSASVTEEQLNQPARLEYSLAQIPLLPPPFPSSNEQDAEHTTSTRSSYTQRPFFSNVQRKTVVPAPFEGETQLECVIQAARSSGHALDKHVQRRLERGLGADLSHVRVHTDNEADSLARSVHSLAFTTGPDIFFRSGRYHPGSSQGFHLLAHEVTHVVQQAKGPVAGTLCAGRISISDPSDRFEQAAEASAARVVAGHQGERQSPPRVQQLGRSIPTRGAIQRYTQKRVDYNKQTAASLAIIKRNQQVNKDANFNAGSLQYTERGEQKSYSDLSKSGLELHSEEALLLQAVGGQGVHSEKEDMKEVAKRFAELDRGDATLYTERQPCQGKCKGLLETAMPHATDKVFYSVPLDKEMYPQNKYPDLYKQPRSDVKQLKFLIKQQSQPEGAKGQRTLESLIQKPGQKIEQKQQKQKVQEGKQEKKKEVIDLTL